MEQDLEITEPLEEIEFIIDVNRSTYQNDLSVTLTGPYYSMGRPNFDITAVLVVAFLSQSTVTFMVIFMVALAG